MFYVCKIQEKNIDGIEKYAYVIAYPEEMQRNVPIIGSDKSIIKSGLILSDYMQGINIDPENTRFICGDGHTKEIYNLKIEGQKPDEIIPYKSLGRQWYFWYYKDLKSNKSGKNLDVSLSD